MTATAAARSSKFRLPGEHCDEQCTFVAISSRGCPEPAALTSFSYPYATTATSMAYGEWPMAYERHACKELQIWPNHSRVTRQGSAATSLKLQIAAPLLQLEQELACSTNGPAGDYEAALRHISEARPSLSDKIRVVLLWALRHEGDNERLSGLVQRLQLLD